MKKFAVIVAGGSGQRMNSSVPKQFMLLRNRPVIAYTIEVFLSAFEDLSVILVLPELNLQDGEAIRKSFLTDETRIFPVAGGSTRFHSVQNGLKLVSDPSIVFVHDGVRCLISRELIVRCYEQAMDKGSAIPAVAATDSIRIIDGDRNRVANRDDVRIIQTPQTFRSNLLLPAFEQSFDEAFTDEATVVEAAGSRVWLINGEYENIKITRPTDLLLAERILQERSSAFQ